MKNGRKGHQEKRDVWLHKWLKFLSEWTFKIETSHATWNCRAATKFGSNSYILRKVKIQERETWHKLKLESKAHNKMASTSTSLHIQIHIQPPLPEMIEFENAWDQFFFLNGIWGVNPPGSWVPWQKHRPSSIISTRETDRSQPLEAETTQVPHGSSSFSKPNCHDGLKKYTRSRPFRARPFQGENPPSRCLPL